MLDIESFMLALGVGNISFAVLMAGYARGPAANAGLRLWMWARLTLGLCQMLAWTDLQMGLSWSAGISAAGWLVGVAMEVAAYCIFFKFERWRRVVLPTTALALVLVYSARLAGASHGQVIALIAVMIAVFAAGMASILLRPSRRAPLLQRIIGLNDALFASAMLVWAWAGYREAGLDLFASGPIQSFAFLAGYVLMIVNGFGFLLLCKQKDDDTMLRMATVDALTGLLNRQAFFDQAGSARPRSGAGTALMMLDLDHFKSINDRFGHASGDAALQLFAARARAVLGAHGLLGRATLGRIGGEEFAIALGDILFERAIYVAEQLRAAITQVPLVVGGAQVTMTVSIGVVQLGAGEALTAALARADQALYDAKRGGRNRVEPALHGVERPVPADLAACLEQVALDPFRPRQFDSRCLQAIKKFVEQ